MNKKNGKNNHHNNNGRNNHRNEHHIYPRSRFPELAGDQNNKSSVITKKHAIYHVFFSNDPPEQIIKNIRILFPRPIAFMIITYLNRKFWRGLFDVDMDRKNMVFPLFKIVRKNKGKSMIVVD